MKFSIAVIPVLAAFIGIAPGCAQDQEPPAPATAGASAGVTEEPIGTIIASVDVEAGHLIRFYEVEPGLVVVTESGELDKQPPLLAQQEIGSYVELFQTLAPDRAVPPTLLAAEERRAALRTQVTGSRPPDDDVVSNGDGHSFYTAGEQTWFRQTFCPFGTPKCIQGWDWIDSGWDYTSDWRSTAFVGSEGTVAAPHIAYWWKCSGSSCWWQTLSSANVSPGYYHWISGGGGVFYFRSTLTGAGGGTQVSMAITNGPYRCVKCYDGTCQCGYNTPENMCSGRGGPNFSLGCGQQT